MQLYPTDRFLAMRLNPLCRSSKPMPKLLLLFEYPTLNGGEYSALAVLRDVRDAGFLVTAAAPPAGPLASRLASDGVEIEPLSAVSADGARLSLRERRCQLSKIIKRRAPDLMHANSLSMSRLAGPVARNCRVPSIGHLRDILKLSAAAIADLNCNQRLLAVSRATRDWHVSAGLDSAKTFVLNNGVNLDQFQPRPPSGYLHDELGLPRGAPLIGTIGQIGMRKGLDDLFAAAEMIADWRLPIGDCGELAREAASASHFLVIGERSSDKAEALRFEQDLIARSQQAPLTGRMHLLGRRDDMPRVFSELTMLVHAARQEPLGRVLLEAAAAALPMVATNVGGTPEIFPAESNASKLVPAGDSPALARAIAEILGDPSLRRQLGQAARRRAEQCFDARDAAAGLIRHYRHVLQTTHTPQSGREFLKNPGGREEPC